MKINFDKKEILKFHIYENKKFFFVFSTLQKRVFSVFKLIMYNLSVIVSRLGTKKK